VPFATEPENVSALLTVMPPLESLAEMIDPMDRMGTKQPLSLQQGTENQPNISPQPMDVVLPEPEPLQPVDLLAPPHVVVNAMFNQPTQRSNQNGRVPRHPVVADTATPANIANGSSSSKHGRKKRYLNIITIL
jgi:hypothetical protein